MSRKAQNKLTIEPLPAGGFRMFGYVLGRKIRRWNADLQPLEAEKCYLLEQAAQQDRVGKKELQLTWLSTEQMRSAESLFHEFRELSRPLHEYIRAGVSVLGSSEPVLITFAIEQWETDMRDEQKLYPRTIKANIHTAENFAKHSKVKLLGEIASPQIDRFISLSNIEAKKGETPSMYSKIARAARLRAFLTFCVNRRWLARSPFEVDMAKLQSQATKLKARPMILTTGQCEALLHAAIEYDPRFVPYVILTTWCFMRSAEARRCVPEDVKLKNKTPLVELFPRKNGTAAYRTVNIPANILPLLRDCIETKLWTPKTEPFFKEGSWKTLRAHAGIIQLGPRNAKGYRAVLDDSHWQENIQRHSGISYLYNLTGDMTEVTRQAGNSDDTAFKHYLNIPQEGESEKFYAIKATLKKEVATEAQSAA